MTTHAKHRPFVGQPGYGGICEGSVGEQGPPDEPVITDETREPPPKRGEEPPGPLGYRRGPPDEDDEDDERDDAPRFELPQIGVPVDKTE
jgi:hypothetical protein